MLLWREKQHHGWDHYDPLQLSWSFEIPNNPILPKPLSPRPFTSRLSPPLAEFLCTILVTIPWAEPPSFIEWHSIGNLNSSSPRTYKILHTLRINEQEHISVEYKPSACWEYELHKIGRDVDIFTLILMWPSPCCVNLTLFMTCSHMQKINMLK